MKEIINTDQAPAAIGTYSQAVRVGDTVYLSGQIGLDPATMTLVDGLEEQRLLEELIEETKPPVPAGCEELHYLEVVKKTVKSQGAVLQENPAETPKFTELYLRFKKGDVIIHAKKQMLLAEHKEIDSIGYPFVLSKAEQSDEYLACRINSCFSHDRNITRLIQKIEEAVK